MSKASRARQDMSSKQAYDNRNASQTGKHSSNINDRNITVWFQNKSKMVSMMIGEPFTKPYYADCSIDKMENLVGNFYIHYENIAKADFQHMISVSSAMAYESVMLRYKERYRTTRHLLISVFAGDRGSGRDVAEIHPVELTQEEYMKFIYESKNDSERIVIYSNAAARQTYADIDGAERMQPLAMYQNDNTGHAIMKPLFV